MKSPLSSIPWPEQLVFYALAVLLFVSLLMFFSACT
jgi:hypothetical protein